MRIFQAPKVNYKKPKVDTFIAFLQSKGWTPGKQWKGFLLMNPPEKNGTAATFYLPCNENDTGYDELAFRAVETFAGLYEMKLQDLFDLLSKSLNEIESEVKKQPQQLEIKRAMLAATR